MAEKGFVIGTLNKERCWQILYEGEAEENRLLKLKIADLEHQIEQLEKRVK